MTKKAKLPDLEKSLQEVTALVEKMEQGDLTLEQSLSHFERGIVLIKHAQSLLKDAEQKVQILMQNKDSENLHDFNIDENDE
jgi:exodeoxyribonuclease VII small subunit